MEHHWSFIFQKPGFSVLFAVQPVPDRQLQLNGSWKQHWVPQGHSFIFCVCPTVDNLPQKGYHLSVYTVLLYAFHWYVLSKVFTEFLALCHTFIWNCFSFTFLFSRVDRSGRYAFFFHLFIRDGQVFLLHSSPLLPPLPYPHFPFWPTNSSPICHGWGT